MQDFCVFIEFFCAGAERIWPPSGTRAQRGRMERGAAKWRGRGLGQRNMGFEEKLRYKTKKEKKKRIKNENSEVKSEKSTSSSKTL